MKNSFVKKDTRMVVEKLPGYFLLALIFLVGYYLYQVVEPFLIVLIISAVIATVTYPIYSHLLKLTKNRKRLSSAITCLVVIIAIVIPISLFVLVLAGQVMDLYHYVSDSIRGLDLAVALRWQSGNWLYDLSGDYANSIADFTKSNFQALKDGLTESAKVISSFAASQSAKILASIGLMIFNFFLMLFSLYFFYKDGDKIVTKLMRISPIPFKHEKELLRKFREISIVTMIGTFLTAVVQGIIAWIGFSIAGVPNAFFWGTAVSVASLIPVVGTTLVTIPVAVGTILSGQFGWGIFLLIWGLGVVATIDNVVRIIFIGSTINLNPLLTFLAVFGGITAFGLPGVIFGPMVLVLFITLLHIYELEYAAVLQNEKEEPPLATT